jgi:hypothetical protein
MRPFLALVRRRVAPLCLAVLVAGASGCLTAEGTLDPDGTGTVTIAYKVPAGMTEAAVRALLEAPGVTVESVSLGADRMASAKLKVTDLAGISKTKLLKDATVTQSAQGDDKTLTITFTNAPGRGAADKSLPGPKIKITLPGPVAEANEKAVVEGSTVTWTFPSLADWVARDKWELVARYRPPDAAGTTH